MERANSSHLYEVVVEQPMTRQYFLLLKNADELSKAMTHVTSSQDD